MIRARKLETDPEVKAMYDKLLWWNSLYGFERPETRETLVCCLCREGSLSNCATFIPRNKDHLFIDASYYHKSRKFNKCNSKWLWLKSIIGNPRRLDLRLLM